MMGAGASWEIHFGNDQVSEGRWPDPTGHVVSGWLRFELLDVWIDPLTVTQ